MDEVPDATRAEVSARLAEQAAVVRRAGMKAETHMAVGLPSAAIDEMAEYLKVDLVTMCSRGHTLQEAVLLGSVADRFMRIARFPLLLLRCSVLYESGEHRCGIHCARLFEHVLFATDFSDNAAAAFDVLVGLASATSPRVSLVHVQDRTRIEPHLSDRLEEFNKTDSQRLGGMSEELKAAGATDIATKVVYGHPVVDLLSVIGEESPTLVLLGNQGRGWVRELFLGSVAHNVARLTEVPVLLIPHGR